jgi:hypothetical protein
VAKGEGAGLVHQYDTFDSPSHTVATLAHTQKLPYDSCRLAGCTTPVEMSTQENWLGCAWLVRLLPELSEVLIAPIGTPPREDERRLMFAAARRYLANVAGPAGTLLVLDDLQWAGSDGLDLLAALLQVEAERPLRVVGAYRSTEIGASDPLGGLVADLARDGHIQQFPLGPLAQAEARQLLSNLLTDTVLPTAIQADRLVQFTGGVPFFLVSCLQGLHTGALAAEAEETATPGVPWNVAQTIHQRVAALPAAAQELLDVAAVMGRMVPGALLARWASPTTSFWRDWRRHARRACSSNTMWTPTTSRMTSSTRSWRVH